MQEKTKNKANGKGYKPDSRAIRNAYRDNRINNQSDYIVIFDLLGKYGEEVFISDGEKAIDEIMKYSVLEKEIQGFENDIYFGVIVSAKYNFAKEKLRLLKILYGDAKNEAARLKKPLTSILEAKIEEE